MAVIGVHLVITISGVACAGNSYCGALAACLGADAAAGNNDAERILTLTIRTLTSSHTHRSLTTLLQAPSAAQTAPWPVQGKQQTLQSILRAVAFASAVGASVVQFSLNCWSYCVVAHCTAIGLHCTAPSAVCVIQELPQTEHIVHIHMHTSSPRHVTQVKGLPEVDAALHSKLLEYAADVESRVQKVQPLPSSSTTINNSNNSDKSSSTNRSGADTAAPAPAHA
eukprot:11404-Heterococcus_DN1.PRE.3